MRMRHGLLTEIPRYAGITRSAVPESGTKTSQALTKEIVSR
jgi:hypothetical protein